MSSLLLSIQSCNVEVGDRDNTNKTSNQSMYKVTDNVFFFCVAFYVCIFTGSFTSIKLPQLSVRQIHASRVTEAGKAECE